MWLLPINGCNAGTVYAKRPVGDSPEMMSLLDCSLNKDLHCGVHQHVTLTALLENNNSKSFSLANVKKLLPIKNTYSTPPSALMPGFPVHSAFYMIPKSLYNKQGVLVPGLGSRKKGL